jgi:hypothetical protein
MFHNMYTPDECFVYTSYTGHCLSTFERADLLPALPERSDPDHGLVRATLDVLDIEELILSPERQEVSKERVEVRLRPKMEDLRIVGVVDVCEHPK